MITFNNKNKGFALIEITVAIGIAATFFFGMLQFINTSARTMRSERYTREAGLLLAEGQDAVKFMRDAGWTAYISSLSLEATYYISPSGNSWSFTTNDPGVISGLYTRTLVLHEVLRDASGNIVSAGGTADANSRRVTATITWSGPYGARNITSAFYVNNIFRN
ncbi:MAG: hypothetical protein A3A80_02610 [Candidatus Terrybacteria bacterium RIFCSPLOWO2_01_FULL_44_24]|uniref:Uncharacterized protein n=1 Tax=Candidatus Terrybacteria bacterium RIFCSPHIGHO2_01_FULL_43_35 TaxID=1802361 RepID=A0A1G2PEJ2_9BACT|nr:MAG: hypothetical protein A2828_02405 [Candidatus Terrybacteria bacterium RIFCSPHIGHO2_01_FULL_43_35]OHA50283.1 MAG: hypothetical protein A3B75_00590 [Candidatus Terrybacteria bacterium RIFCSPHIGHO2_02_FULL_43_14]OHA50964.1 MAG: hypothetical protein A3A80_02610 [Candidatus Terrybacteria bacterium RIFCSPLOWO2_01_FULL_44_24]